MKALFLLALVPSVAFASEAVNRVAPLHGAAAIQGSLHSSAECAQGQVQAWVSQGKTLLYQTEVPLGGTYEFHLVPGKYNLVATGSTGCFAEATFEVKPDESRELDLDLVKAKRGPAQEDGK